MTQTLERATAETAARPSACQTILVHAEPALGSSHRVEVAGRLARDLGARLIGLGAETFEPMATAEPFMGFGAAELVMAVQDQIGKNLDAAQDAFRRDAAGVELEWRQVQDYPHRALANLAHAADLIVVSPRGRAGADRTADPADVVMSAGRPVLMIPPGRHHLHGMAVVVAWKNTPECRRALGDALPFLQRADDVIILAVTTPADGKQASLETSDVVANLKRHGVEARALVTTAAPDGVTAEIERVAQLNNADLIVCGAYGHSRLREWAFGGVTDDLLHRPDCFVLFSH